MAKYIEIERPNGMVTIVRSELETGSEEPLTEHEQIINELYSKVKNLNIPAVIKSVCNDYFPSFDEINKCLHCGFYKHEH